MEKVGILVLFVSVLFIGTLAFVTPTSVNAKTEKQVEVTPVQNLQYYGVFPHGVSSFETSDAKCFVNNSQLNRDDRSRVSISCFKK
ncbi:MAG: hypothetical protein J6W29_04955 [Neisseriaceae bacterium]|nr:hypothetical protein [Neisseriaceae bacterium]